MTFRSLKGSQVFLPANFQLPFSTYGQVWDRQTDKQTTAINPLSPPHGYVRSLEMQIGAISFYVVSNPHQP